MVIPIHMPGHTARETDARDKMISAARFLLRHMPILCGALRHRGRLSAPSYFPSFIISPTNTIQLSRDGRLSIRPYIQRHDDKHAVTSLAPPTLILPEIVSIAP